MKEKKTFARHEVEANIDKISELIKNGIFFIDIYHSLDTKILGSYENFLRLIKSGRYPELTEAIKLKKKNENK